MRRSVVFSVLMALALPGCLSPRQGATPTRTTPAGTVEMFKQFARQGDRAGEWDVLSPGLKQRLAQRVGREVDLADYIQARSAYRNNSQVRLAEQALQTAIVTNTRQVDANTVMATIQTSGGPFARSANIRMIRLERWMLWVHGQDEPYQGTVGDPEFTASRQGDGSYVIAFRSADGRVSQEVVPAQQVRNYETASKWYVDHLGELESQFLVN
jgi:hypothetical protein